MDLLERVEDYIARHRLLRPGDRVLAAVSGGPDSLALLHLFTRLRAPWALGLHAVHVNHGLRPEAAQDAAFVESVGQAWGVPVTVVAVDVRAERAPGESLQQAARRVRYRVLAQAADQVSATRIALGHHADDQAETVLLRLLRGAGTTGLAGMRPRRGRYIRPLLGVPRAAIEAYCRRFELNPRVDPSNVSPQYLRNRIRHHLLPLLEREYNPNIRAVLCRTAGLLREEDDLLEALAVRAHRRLAAQGGPHELPVAGLARLPAAVARRVVRRALAAAGVPLSRVTADHVAAVLALLDGVGAVDVPGGVRARRAGDRIRLERPPSGPAVAPAGPAPPAFFHPLDVPGKTAVGELGLVIRAEIVEPPASRAVAADPRAASGPMQAVLDWDRLVLPLVVRSWQPGDRMRPLGLDGTKKLQDLFVDAKVPAGERRRVPIIADQAGPVWVVGLRVDARAAVTAETQRVLRLRVEPVSGEPGSGENGR
ncbi:MAG TPA: tRNA lysidine(34) synthetase TilS [Limnochordales bacterium]|nr:tRNA lysidine(34) synthetase TilS [Limnochordales bacterium]